ncbi:MAG TPA: phosphoribosyltransferase family protein [Candidatus Acidoferrales bacterium]|nr:phosphoribosyltransferase family protein [Candidatus Acidoferrales bacterium]
MKVAYSRRELAARITELGKAISKDYRGRTLDVVSILENSFLFAADLVRQISCPVVCHFVRTEMRDVELGGATWPELFFSTPPRLQGRDVLLVDVMLHTGVPQDFLWKRIEDYKPQSLSLAVLFDKARDHKVGLKAAYVGFTTASKHWVGYGLPGRGGLYRNLPYVATAEKNDEFTDGDTPTAGAGGGKSRKAPKQQKGKRRAG